MKVNELLIKYVNELKLGSALDLGSGDGTNVAFLRDRGFEVEWVKKNYNTTLEEYTQKPTRVFDNIVCFYVLHFLKKKDARNVIEFMKNNTITGGFNLISDFTSEVTWDKAHGSYFEPNELKEIYSDWEIIYYKEKAVRSFDGTLQMSAFLCAKKK